MNPPGPLYTTTKSLNTLLPITAMIPPTANGKPTKLVNTMFGRFVPGKERLAG